MILCVSLLLGVCSTEDKSGAEDKSLHNKRHFLITTVVQSEPLFVFIVLSPPCRDTP